MRYKGTLIGLVLLVGIYFAYVQFIQGTGNDPLLTSNQVAGVDGTRAGQEIIGILREIKGIELDVSLFENEQFNALVDFREDIAPESVGRNNPFDPIGFGINDQGRVAEPTPPDIQLITPESGNKVQETDNEPTS